MTLPDVFVPIHTAAKFLLAVVQVECPYAVDADHAIKFGHRLLVFRRLRDGVARREGMAAIDAHAQPAAVGHIVDNVRQMLKPMPQVGTLSGRVLQPDLNHLTVGLLQHDGQTIDDFLQPLFLAGIEKAARMHHHAQQSQFFGTLQLDDKRINRLLTHIVLGTSQIDEIAIVSTRLLYPGLHQSVAKPFRVVIGQRFGTPLIIVF